jgi:hypothetical protein
VVHDYWESYPQTKANKQESETASPDCLVSGDGAANFGGLFYQKRRASLPR